VVGGDANTGKSTFTATLSRQLEAMGYTVNPIELDVFDDTLDFILGVREWKHWKRKPPGKETWAMLEPQIKRALAEFAKDESDFVLGDLPGGGFDDILDRMVEDATDAIVMGRDIAGIKRWVDYFTRKSIRVILKVIFHGNPRMKNGFHGDETFYCYTCNPAEDMRNVLIGEGVRQMTFHVIKMCKVMQLV
jgi:MinD-like ATPase involved in chromosome partitioning or flagellar assembly